VAAVLEIEEAEEADTQSMEMMAAKVELIISQVPQ
jgi:hypothetical protein